MNVYLYQNNTEKILKNAYIGEYVVPYLCFTANTAGSTVQLTKTGSPTAVTLETSTDGKNWTSYTIGDPITLSNIGDKVYFRNTSTTDTGFSTSTSNYYKFVMTGSIAGSGDVSYLLNKNSTTFVSSYCFYMLFYQCSSLTTAPLLPATTLADSSYRFMFYYCTSLIDCPELQLKQIGANSCQLMFAGCSNMVSLSSIDVTSIGVYGCFSMFNGCSKIKLSTTQTGDYQTAYIIKSSGVGEDALTNMFANTGGSFTGTPYINTTYYTSNTVV